jgi:4-hydroxybenzoate polyprenyltransferase
MVGLLLWMYLLLPLGIPFLAGIVAATGLLAYEHWLLRGGDLSKLDLAFFTMNGYISIIILAATIVDLLAGGRGI